MCTDTASFSQYEKALLDVLKTLYWENGSQAKCHNNHSISSKWFSFPATSQQLDTALRALSNRGCLVSNNPGSFCLTDCGLRAIGILPSSPNDVC